MIGYLQLINWVEYSARWADSKKKTVLRTRAASSTSFVGGEMQSMSGDAPGTRVSKFSGVCIPLLSLFILILSIVFLHHLPMIFAARSSVIFFFGANKVSLPSVNRDFCLVSCLLIFYLLLICCCFLIVCFFCKLCCCLKRIDLFRGDISSISLASSESSKFTDSSDEWSRSMKFL